MIFWQVWGRNPRDDPEHEIELAAFPDTGYFEPYLPTPEEYADQWIEEHKNEYLDLRKVRVLITPKVNMIDLRTGKPFPRGLVPTPRHKLAAATPFRPVFAPPTQVIRVPKQLDMWGNDQYGDCVTAEEAFAKACYDPEIFIPTQTVVAWASKHGVLNGADLPSVMDSFQNDGFVVGSQKYDDGPYLAVDYSNETVLQAAIAQGPVKFGLDANALPGGAGNHQGWYAFGGRPGQFGNEDHCMDFPSFGTAAQLFAALGVPVPANAPAGILYMAYTWSTIGVVDHPWIMSTVGEAFVRNPTTIGVPPLGPPPPPTPPTPPANQLMIATALPAQTFAAGTGTVVGPIAPGLYTIGPLPPVPPPPPPPTPGGLSPEELAGLATADQWIQKILSEQRPGN